jgi:L-lactate dehydrogenase complex protein LldF
VKINIPRHLINLRRDINRQHLNSPIERIVYRLWAWAMRSPFLYAMIGTLQKWDLRRRAKGSGWVGEMPSVAAGWTQVRDMPAPASRTFHQVWRERK